MGTKIVIMNITQSIADLATALEALAGAKLADAMVIEVRRDLVGHITAVLEAAGKEYFIREDEQLENVLRALETEEKAVAAVRATNQAVTDAGELDPRTWFEIPERIEVQDMTVGEFLEQLDDALDRKLKDLTPQPPSLNGKGEEEELPAAVELPAPAGKGKRTPKTKAVCKNCGREFLAQGKKQEFCREPECRKAHHREINERHATRTGVGRGGWQKPLNNGHTWLIEDGLLAGQILEPEELRLKLENGTELIAGQKLRNSKYGQCKVIKFPGKNLHLGIKGLHGDYTNRIIELGK